MSDTKIQWHPGFFVAAMDLEFKGTANRETNGRQGHIGIIDGTNGATDMD